MIKADHPTIPTYSNQYVVIKIHWPTLFSTMNCFVLIAILVHPTYQLGSGPASDVCEILLDSTGVRKPSASIVAEFPQSWASFHILRKTVSSKVRNFENSRSFLPKSLLIISSFNIIVKNSLMPNRQCSLFISDFGTQEKCVLLPPLYFEWKAPRSR